MANRFDFPYLGFGLGLRQPHYDTVLNEKPAVDWFEIITENFMEAHQGHWEFLAEIRQDYPIALHGVGLSVGGIDPLPFEYLERLKILAEFVQAPWVSDHLCWTGISGATTHDLLPIPYTEEALTHVARRVREVQDRLERPLVLENPSSYVTFRASAMPEWEFLARLAEEADCAILLDVNNVYVSGLNHGFDPYTYIEAMPADRVVEIHLAGHDHRGSHVVDTHDSLVSPEVWALYDYALRRLGPVSSMIERDEQIPPFLMLLAELAHARRIAEHALANREERP